jgi:dTDP-4-amino-4,6-dideoxygalactose transaminase
LGIGEGDEVIIPSQTHVATAHAVELTGAKPIFVDSDKISGNIDITLVEQKINKSTKAISVVHYLGTPVDMVSINMIAKKYNLFVLEDCALSPGAYIDNQHTGLLGDVGVFSFYPVKHMTTAEGGMIILKDKNLYEKIKLNKAFGVDRTHNERSLPGMYDVVSLGFNYRLSEINCAIGVEQLKKLPMFLDQRHENFNYLKDLFTKQINLTVVEDKILKFSNSSHYCLSIILDNKLINKRAFIMNKLKKIGIGTSIYYPQPVPRMKYYQSKYMIAPSEYVNASVFSDNSIALPVGPHLKISDMKIIANEINKIIKDIND